MKTNVEYDICDIPFDGYYAPPFQAKPRRFGCPLSRRMGHNDQGPPFDRFGPFDQQAQMHHHHHHWHYKRAAEEKTKPGCGHHSDRDWRQEQHWQGPPGFRGPPGPQEFHRHGFNNTEHPWFGRGPSDVPERSWGGPWVMFWGRPDQQRPGFGQGPPQS